MRPLLLLGVAVFELCSVDSMAQALGEEPTQEVVVISCSLGHAFEEELTQDSRREALRVYVSQLDEQTDSQIEDMESLISSELVHALREDHYDWRRARDIYCWEAGRNSSNDLEELECLEALTTLYYDQREVEISDLQARQGPTD